MEKKETIDEKGRKYLVLSDGTNEIPIGPPEGIVDRMGLPEPFATILHNVLYQRGLMSYRDIAAGKQAIGALQEALSIDAQKLVEAYLKFETETEV